MENNQNNEYMSGFKWLCQKFKDDESTKWKPLEKAIQLSWGGRDMKGLPGFAIILNPLSHVFGSITASFINFKSSIKNIFLYLGSIPIDLKYLFVDPVGALCSFVVSPLTILTKSIVDILCGVGCLVYFVVSLGFSAVAGLIFLLYGIAGGIGKIISIIVKRAK